MTIDRIVMAVAGTMILVSLALSQLHNINWLWFTAFVGANLLQSSLTGFCPMVKLVKLFGARPGVAFQ